MWTKKLSVVAILTIHLVTCRSETLKKSFILEYSGDTIAIEYNFDPKNQMSYLICNKTVCNATIESYRPYILKYKYTCVMNMTIQRSPIMLRYRQPKVFAGRKLVIVWLTVNNDGKYLNVRLVDMANCEIKGESFLIETGGPNEKAVDYSLISNYMKDKVNIATFKNSFDIVYQSYMCNDSVSTKALNQLPGIFEHPKLGLLCRISYDENFNKFYGPRPFFPEIIAVESVNSVENLYSTFSWYLISGLRGLYLGYPNGTFFVLKRNNFILSDDSLNIQDHYDTLKWWWYYDIYYSDFVRLDPNYRIIPTKIKMNASEYDDTVRYLRHIFELPSGDLLMIMLSRDYEKANKVVQKYFFKILSSDGKVIKDGKIAELPKECSFQFSRSFLYGNSFDYSCELDEPNRFSTKFKYYKNVTIYSKIMFSINAIHALSQKKTFKA